MEVKKLEYGKKYEIVSHRGLASEYGHFEAIYIGTDDNNLFFTENKGHFEFFRLVRLTSIGGRKRIMAYQDFNIRLSGGEEKYLLNRMKNWENKAA